MGAIVGLVIGYALGARAGKDGWAELRDACAVIRSSDEVRDLVSGGLLIARDLLARGVGMLTETLGASGDRRSLRVAA
jgi:hypothetical protein